MLVDRKWKAATRGGSARQVRQPIESKANWLAHRVALPNASACNVDQRVFPLNFLKPETSTLHLSVDVFVFKGI